MSKRQMRHLSEKESARIVNELGCIKASDYSTSYYIYKVNGFNVYIEQEYAHGYPAIQIYYAGKDKNTKLDIESLKSRLPAFALSNIKHIEIARASDKFKEDDVEGKNSDARLIFHIPLGLGVPKNIPIVKNIIDSVTYELVQLGFTHGCGDCHSHDYLESYFHKNELITLCTICNERRKNEAKNQSTDKYMKENEQFISGIVATIISAVVCFVGLAILKYALIDYEKNDPNDKVMYLFTLGVLVPMLTNFIMILFYKAFADAFTIKSIIISTVLTLASATLCNFYLAGGETIKYLNVTVYGAWLVSLIVMIVVMYKSARQPDIPIQINC